VAELHNNLGLAFRGLGRSAEEIRQFGRALALKPDYAEAHANLAATLKSAGGWTKRRTIAARALALRPLRRQPTMRWGPCCRSGPLRQARAAYARSAANPPAYPEAHNNIGVVRLARMHRGRGHGISGGARLRPDYAEAHIILEPPCRPPAIRKTRSPNIDKPGAEARSR